MLELGRVGAGIQASWLQQQAVNKTHDQML